MSPHTVTGVDTSCTLLSSRKISLTFSHSRLKSFSGMYLHSFTSSIHTSTSKPPLISSTHRSEKLPHVNRFHCCVNPLKHILILNNLAVLYRSLFQLLICFVSSQPIFFIILFNLLVPCLIRTSQALEKLNLSPKLRKKGFLAKNGFTFPKFPFWQNPIFPKVLDS